MIRLAIFILLVYVLVKVIRKVVPTGHRRPRSAPSRSSGTELVQDPVCGVYIARSQAIPLTRQGTTHYFCSQQCRDRFVSANS